GSVQTVFHGAVDAFATKLDPAGSMLMYSTYLGGSGSDAAVAIALEASGAVYIAGSTNSTDFPISDNAFQKRNHGESDVFLAKLNATGTALNYSTYLGGAGNDDASSLAIDTAGDLFISGQTDSPDFPLAAGR